MLAKAGYLFRTDRGLHDEARGEFTLCVERFEISKKSLRSRFLDQLYMDEHRHLVDNECSPERVRIQVVGVLQESIGPDIF